MFCSDEAYENQTQHNTMAIFLPILLIRTSPSSCHSWHCHTSTLALWHPGTLANLRPGILTSACQWARTAKLESVREIWMFLFLVRPHMMITLGSLSFRTPASPKTKMKMNHGWFWISPQFWKGLIKFQKAIVFRGEVYENQTQQITMAWFLTILLIRKY